MLEEESLLDELILRVILKTLDIFYDLALRELEDRYNRKKIYETEGEVDE